jgi:hypothetical protein
MPRFIVIASLAVLGTSSGQQERLELVRTEIIAVALPVQGAFGMWLPVPGPSSTALATFDFGEGPTEKTLVLRLGTDGKIKTTFERSAHVPGRSNRARIAMDSSGNLYCFTLSGSGEKTGPAVYVFEEDGKFREKVLLSRRFSPRRMVVTPARTCSTSSGQVGLLATSQ